MDIAPTDADVVPRAKKDLHLVGVLLILQFIPLLGLLLLLCLASLPLLLGLRIGLLRTGARVHELDRKLADVLRRGGENIANLYPQVLQGVQGSARFPGRNRHPLDDLRFQVEDQWSCLHVAFLFVRECQSARHWLRHPALKRDFEFHLRLLRLELHHIILYREVAVSLILHVVRNLLRSGIGQLDVLDNRIAQRALKDDGRAFGLVVGHCEIQVGHKQHDFPLRRVNQIVAFDVTLESYFVHGHENPIHIVTVIVVGDWHKLQVQDLLNCRTADVV